MWVFFNTRMHEVHTKLLNLHEYPTLMFTAKLYGFVTEST